MAALKLELDQLAPGVDFRASRRHVHHTWARTFFARPELYIRPQSLEEVQAAVNLARRHRKQITVTGSGHSPSTLTCTSSWLMNLDDYAGVVAVDEGLCRIVVQAGIRLHDLQDQLWNHGLAMPNLGSIDEQSIAGAISTGTHGSTLQHGLLSSDVLALKIVLSNGSVVSCSKDHNTELFEASLLSLGALGVIVEITFQAVRSFKLEWTQEMVPISAILDRWDTLWSEAEFVRCWWLPYTERMILWKADRTNAPLRARPQSWYGGALGYYLYHNLLYVSHWIPSILPWVEKFVFGLQYTFGTGLCGTAVEESSAALKIDCLYSQFVNEWALPLEQGPQAIKRLQSWLTGSDAESGIPFDSRGVYVHAPIEVRVSDTSKITPRPHLDQSNAQGPTLYLNATLYRPYHKDPPCRKRYYEAFETLMKELDGRPHWAKNFDTVTPAEFWEMYPRMKEWFALRDKVDPDEIFVNKWLQSTLLEGQSAQRLRLQTQHSPDGSSPGLKSATSAESFDMMHAVEAEKSVLL